MLCTMFYFFVDENERFWDFGDEINPSNTQSASKIVKSFSWPKNNVDNSNSLIFSLTAAPRTYKLKWINKNVFKKNCSWFLLHTKWKQERKNRTYSPFFSGRTHTQLNFHPKSIYKSLPTVCTIFPVTTLFKGSPNCEKKYYLKTKWWRILSKLFIGTHTSIKLDSLSIFLKGTFSTGFRFGCSTNCSISLNACAKLPNFVAGSVFWLVESVDVFSLTLSQNHFNCVKTANCDGYWRSGTLAYWIDFDILANIFFLFFFLSKRNLFPNEYL